MAQSVQCLWLLRPLRTKGLLIPTLSYSFCIRQQFLPPCNLLARTSDRYCAVTLLEYLYPQFLLHQLFKFDIFLNNRMCADNNINLTV